MPIEDCAPDGPRVNIDLEDIIAWDPAIKFTPADATAPRMGEPVELIENPEAKRQYAMMAKEHEPPSGTSIPFGKGYSWLQVPNELFKAIEYHTKIPVYRWYRYVEDARRDVSLHTFEPFEALDALGEGLSRNQLQMVQMLLEAKHTARLDYSKLAAKADQASVRGAEVLEKIYRDYFTKLGDSPEDIDQLFKAFPQLRAHNGDFRMFSTHRSDLPMMMRRMQKSFDTGEVLLDSREWNAWTIGRRVIRADANARFFYPAWDLISQQVEIQANTSGLLYYDYFISYMNEARHAPDWLQRSIQSALGKISRTTFGQELPDAVRRDVVSVLLYNNYYVNMAWNPGVALRNILQTFTNTVPIMGSDTLHGFQLLSDMLQRKQRWGGNIFDKLVERGVLVRDVEPQAAIDVKEQMADALGGSEGRKFFRTLYNEGWAMFRNAEVGNRVIAYGAQYERALREANKYLAGKQSFTEFWERSALDWLDPGGEAGPFTAMVRDVLHEGNAEGAAHRMALEFTNRTQYIYTRGNNPYIMQGTAGRIFGQYGTWPAWYLSYLGSTVMRGTPANRVKRLARWAGVQSAVYYGASEVFGVDMGRWTFFSPLGYVGGPAMQMAQQGLATLDMATQGQLQRREGDWLPTPVEGADPISIMQYSRFLRSYQQVVPIPIEVYRIHEAYKAYLDEDWKTAAKRFGGFTPTQE